MPLSGAPLAACQAASQVNAAAEPATEMPAAVMTDTATAIPPAAQDNSLIPAVLALWLGFKQRLHLQLQLLLLETQRAAQSLVNMLILALFAALLLMSCWLGLLGVGVLLLKSAGLSTLVALVCALMLNLLALFICLKLIRRQSSYLRYPASMALLTTKAPDTGPTPDA